MVKNFSLLHKSYFIFQKDLRLEFRTRYTVNAIFLFALTTLVAVSFSISAVGLSSNISASLLWIILFFSSMTGLSHIFVREEEQQTADTLRLVAPPTAIYLGKLFFNTILLLGLEIIIVPLYLVFMNISVGNIPLFFVVMLFGSVGISSVATIIAAIISRANAKGALFAVLSFPITLPILVSAIHGTTLSIQGKTFLNCMSEIQVLISFTIVIVTASILLFEFVWIT